MDLGEKLLRARQEAGLSQRQLCEDVITRNMLSQIEHGVARPSMDTLRKLAQRLGKPVSFFLEEDVVTSPNQSRMALARQAYEKGAFSEAEALLREFRQPDPVLEWEWKYLSCRTVMAAAQIAAAEGKYPYARQILESAEESHGIPELNRERLLLLGRIPGTDPEEIVRQLPPLDDELMIRAEAALKKGEPVRAVELLAAAENRESSKWNLLQGRALLLQKQYAPAANCLQAAEGSFPEVCWPLLEVCFRELGDFRQAYVYACRQR